MRRNPAVGAKGARQAAESKEIPQRTAFDDIRGLFQLMPEPSQAAIEAVEQRQRELTKPTESLGRLEELVAWLAGWQGKDMPTLDRPLVAVFAGNHGVVAQGVSAYPAEVTRQMVANFSLAAPRSTRSAPSSASV